MNLAFKKIAVFSPYLSNSLIKVNQDLCVYND